MDSHIPSMFLTTLATICVSLLTAPPQSHSEPHDYSNLYADCTQPFNCGPAVSNISYPFWGGRRPQYCGGARDFKLHCNDEEDGQHASIQIGSQNFTVLHIHNTNYTARMSRENGTSTDVCSAALNDMGNIALSHSSSFRYTDPEALHNITIFRACPQQLGSSYGEGNTDMCPNDPYLIAFFEVVNDTALYQEFPKLRNCNESIKVPLSKSVLRVPDIGNIDALDQALGEGFEVNYTVRFAQDCIGCVESGGACGTNDNATFQFTCHCPDGSDDASLCHGSNNIPIHSTRRHWKCQVIIGVAGAVVAGLLTICCFICKLSKWQEKCWLPTKSNQDIETFLKTHGALTLKRYKYSDVKKMTNSFKIKLRQGGFGAVYKGNLLNGTNVAVKILNRSKGNGEDFINEVATISRTSHVNVVTLLGFA